MEGDYSGLNPAHLPGIASPNRGNTNPCSDWIPQRLDKAGPHFLYNYIDAMYNLVLIQLHGVWPGGKSATHRATVPGWEHRIWGEIA
jgi:hypothetical protein